MRLLIASCVRQHPAILAEFLESLDRLEKPNHDYLFILSDLVPESRRLIEAWSRDKPVTVETMDFNVPYVTDEHTHHWNTDLVSNVIEMKDRILEAAGGYDYLLLVDSDTYLHPGTLTKLLSHRVDIITEVGWTQWYDDDPRVLPNAWFLDNYGFPPDGLQWLRNKPLVQVGGFGGLYLISRKALEAGVSFSRADGVPHEWGEDRHFAARAKRLNLNLWCDTTLPSFHIYRMSDLPRLREWKANGYKARCSGVVISVPNTGQIKTELVAALLNIGMADPSYVRVDMPQGMPVDSNRNQAVNRFLSTDSEWLLFIDSDVVPPTDVASRLLRHGKRIVSGLVWSSMGGEKGGRWEHDVLPYPTAMVKAEDGWRVAREQLESGETLVEVDAVGMACVLIHREVFEKMGGNWFRLSYGPDGVCDGGEDFTFCARAKEMGYGVWVDKSVRCSHYRTVDLLAINQVLAKTAPQKPGD